MEHQRALFNKQLRIVCMKLIPNIEKVFCLLLDKRYSVKDDIAMSMQSIGISRTEFFLVGNGSLPEKYDHVDLHMLPPVLPNTNFYPSWLQRPNAYNAYLSHAKILNKAKELGLSNVMLVEDDIFIEPDFFQILPKIEEFLDNHEWDMFYFGGYHNDSAKKLTDNILELHGSGGWHAVVLKTKIIDDLLAYGPIGPMDWITGQYIHNKYKCYAAFPSIISQKDGHSFVEGHHLTKPSREKL
jgi:hypothetical protein